MQEQGGEICKRLVEGRYINIGRLHEIAAYAVYDRVGYFVGYDIVGETGEYCLAREVTPLSGRSGREVTEQNSMRIRAIEGVRLRHGMGIKLKTTRSALRGTRG